MGTFNSISLIAESRVGLAYASELRPFVHRKERHVIAKTLQVGSFREGFDAKGASTFAGDWSQTDFVV